MTMTSVGASMRETPWREGLARRELREGLTALLRRRVPRDEVADLVQSVLCDALAAEHAPTEPDALARWVTGIARHKIADYHRRSRRLVLDDGAFEGAAPAQPAPFEARQLLGEVLSRESTARDRETLEWLVQEHAGEPLRAIAETEGLPPPVVRQRVSRLRRWLRSRFGWASLALLVGSAVVTQRALAPDPPRREISADRLDRGADERANVMIGTWRVASYGVPPGASRELRAWLAWLARDAIVRVDEAHVTVTGPGALERTLRSVRTHGDLTRAELVGENGHVLRVVARRSGSGLVVTLSDEGGQGTLTLEPR